MMFATYVRVLMNEYAKSNSLSITYFLARADDVPAVAIKLLESRKVKSRVALE